MQAGEEPQAQREGDEDDAAHAMHPHLKERGSVVQGRLRLLRDRKRKETQIPAEIEIMVKGKTDDLEKQMADGNDGI
jgi:hypothetical protein